MWKFNYLQQSRGKDLAYGRGSAEKNEGYDEEDGTG